MMLFLSAPLRNGRLVYAAVVRVSFPAGTRKNKMGYSVPHHLPCFSFLSHSSVPVFHLTEFLSRWFPARATGKSSRTAGAAVVITVCHYGCFLSAPLRNGGLVRDLSPGVLPCCFYGRYRFPAAPSAPWGYIIYIPGLGTCGSPVRRGTRLARDSELEADFGKRYAVKY